MALYEISDEARMMLDVARKFARGELASAADKAEEREEFAMDMYRKLGELGLLGLRVPVEYGGSAASGGDTLLSYLCNVELSKASAGFALSVGASLALFGNNVAAHGSEAQKRKYLPPLCEGRAMGCWALTEPGAGSDALGITAKAVRDGNEWVLNGQKTFITNAPIADYFIVIARTSGKPGEIAGGTAFILERGDPGLNTGKPFEKMGMKSSPTGEIFLDNVRVADERVLGRPEGAFGDMMASLDYERAAISALSIGIARACLETCVSYAKERKQFGRRIADFQLVQEKIAGMARDIELADTFTVGVLRKLAAGGSATAECAMAKWFASELGTRAAMDAMQILGGYGYMKEYRVERWLRDARVLEIGSGTTEINKLIVARKVLAG